MEIKMRENGIKLLLAVLSNHFEKNYIIANLHRTIIINTIRH
jgi:hypothetical protein